MLCLFASSREILSEVECNFFTASASVAPAALADIQVLRECQRIFLSRFALICGRDARAPSEEVALNFRQNLTRSSKRQSITNLASFALFGALEETLGK